MPKEKIAIVAVSRDCFPMDLSVSRRKAVVAAYTKKYGEGLYECPVCIENEIDMRKALADVKAAGCNAIVVYLGNFGPETPETLLIKEFDRFSDQNITKILWYDEPGNLRKWTEDFGKEEFSQVTCCISQPVFLEFFHRQVSKATAMQKIGERYGISREEMIAVGDGPNESNDDEGVLQVIRKYF